MSAQTWNIDTVHSSVGFWIRHLMVSKVHGRFTGFKGSITFDDKDLASGTVEASVDVATVDTREAARDGHLRSADFFDAEKFPTITFTGRKVEAAAGTEFKLHGDLTIKGHTKPVVLDVEYNGKAVHPQFGERAGFSAKTTIARKDFDLTWNQNLDAGGVVLGDKVDISIELELTRA